MRTFFTVLLGFAISTATSRGADASVTSTTGTPPPPRDVIARVHFAGAARISADRNSAAFTNIFCSAEARALEAQTLDKLARAPGAWFTNKIAPGAGDGSAPLRPLLDDFFNSEWLLEMREAAAGTLEYTLAIRLDSSRAALWQNNLTGLLKSWTQLPIQTIPGGWQLKKDLPPNLFRFVRVGDWVVIGCGENELPMTTDLTQQLAAGKPLVAPEDNNWVSANLNWPRLAQWFPVLGKFDFPKLDLGVMGRDGNLQLNGHFNLAQPLAPLAKWQLPDVIRSPVVSFTAVRGVGPWLARQSWAQSFEFQPPPDQFFIWAFSDLPFLTYAATPVKDTNASLVSLNSAVSAAFARHRNNPFLSQISMTMTSREILWHDVPIMTPFVQPLHEPGGDYLFGGFFQYLPGPQPLSPELAGQLNAPNLVYYQWENTSARLRDLPQLTQLLLLLTQHRQLGQDAAAQKWLDRIDPILGPSVTHATLTAPNEVTFRRTAPAGLTALELIALATWLDAPNFPGCDLTPLPPPKRGPHPFAHPAAPVTLTAPAPSPAKTK
ncbi:MAG: hypothetical protein ABSE16_09555 [Verrucomicrobiota bacterium]|jgi:hypothetical protein